MGRNRPLSVVSCPLPTQVFHNNGQLTTDN